MSASGIAPEEIDPKDFIIANSQIKGLTNPSAPAGEQDAEHESEASENEGNNTPNPSANTNANITGNSADSAAGIHPTIPSDLQDPAQSPSADAQPPIPHSPPPTIFVPSSSDPSSNHLGSHTPCPSPPAPQLDEPFNNSDIVPPSSSLDIPLADVVQKGKKRGTPDTTGSPGMRSSPSLQRSPCLISFSQIVTVALLNTDKLIVRSTW
jgi:hypothetical protein